jgi:hypothetical protein
VEHRRGTRARRPSVADPSGWTSLLMANGSLFL